MQPRRTSLATLVLAAALVIASCSGAAAPAPGGSTSSGPSSTGGPASSAGHKAPSKAILADPCSIVTVADVQGVYGGQVTAKGLDDGSCRFEIEGQAKAGKSVAAGEFAVSFEDEFVEYNKAKVVFGEGVQQVDGLGTPALSALGFVHAKVGAGEIVVGGVFVGDYDRAKLAEEHIEMTKLLLGKF